MSDIETNVADARIRNDVYLDLLSSRKGASLSSGEVGAAVKKYQAYEMLNWLICQR
jgi:hypothetical protein